MLESGPAIRAALPPSTLQSTPPAPIGAAQQSLSEPLPPIAGTPVDRPSTDPLHNGRNRGEETEGEKMTRTKSWTDENFKSSTAPSTQAETVQQADEPVFLTQVKRLVWKKYWIILPKICLNLFAWTWFEQVLMHLVCVLGANIWKNQSSLSE